MKADQVDPPHKEALPHGAAAQGAQLDLPLRSITRLEFRLDVSGVTAELDDPLPFRGVHERQQTGHADLFWMTVTAPLTVEPREVAGAREPAQRQTLLVGPRANMRRDAWVAVHVVVRINVGRRCTDELDEPFQLTIQLLGEARRLRPVQLQVEPETQVRAAARHVGYRKARGAMHEHARAGQDPVDVCFEDPAVDSRTRPEVVSVHDEPLHRPRLTICALMSRP